MEFQFSKRAESFQPNIFNILNEKRQALIESGKKIYNMSVGTPDFPPAQHVLDVVSEAAKNPEEYKYSLGDTGELLSAVEGWYQNRYGVKLKHDAVYLFLLPPSEREDVIIERAAAVGAYVVYPAPCLTACLFFSYSPSCSFRVGPFPDT